MNNYYVYNDEIPQHKRYSNLQSIELKNQVLSCHETFLQLDDNDQRDEYRTKLHRYFVNYLLKIPHNNKFLLPEFNSIFENCIENNSQFDPSKAIDSFDILFRITNNLILKPWRKEFHKICIYNGYFKHWIEPQIPYYEHILNMMGYELKIKNGISNFYLTKRNNNEILKLISFDCYVAYAELRYMHQFGGILRSKNIKPNYQYIFRLRKKFTGDFESTLENYLLIYNDQINEQQQQINRKYKHLSNLISQYEQNQATDNSIDKKHTNGNLIDLESSLPSTATTKFDNLEQLLLNSTLDHHNYQPTLSNYNNPRTLNAGQSTPSSYLRISDDYYLTKHNLVNDNNLSNLNNYNLSFNSPNNVYTNHNNSHNHSNNYYQAPKETNLDQVDFIDDEEDDESITNLKDREFNSNMIKCLDNNAQKLEQAMKSYDKLGDNNLINGKIKSNSLEKKSIKNKSLVDKKYSTLDLNKSDNKKKAQQQQKSSSYKNDKWLCTYCTYANESRDSICKMCSKSMSIKNDNELTIMGRECNRCTLVNKKNSSQCTACGSQLTKLSPTYI